MSVFDFITSMLCLPTESLSRIEENTFLLTLPVQVHVCPHCHKETTLVHDYRKQPLKVSCLIDTPVTLYYRKRRYWCPHCHKAFAEKNPIVSRYQRMAKDTIARIIAEHGSLVSSTDIARRYKIAVPTVQRLFKQISPASMQLDEAISIDEFKGDVGAKFQVVINSLTRHCCLNILEDRTSEILYQQLLEYPLEERLRVKLVSIDLSASFRSMVKACFPNAQLTADKFHTVRMANEALNWVRRKVQETLPQKQRKQFKGSKYLLLTREKNLTKDTDRTALQVMMSRYEMAAIVARAEGKIGGVNPADQALIEKLANEYQSELKKMDERNEARFQQMNEKIDKIQFSGFVRAKYDHDNYDQGAGSGVGAENNNKHFYMNFEGKMKVSNDWDAHFQAETRKGYTQNQSWRGNNGQNKGNNDSDQDGTFQRIWVEGHPGRLGITAGTKWWGLGFQNVPFGHAADGISVDTNFAKDWNAKAFYLRPRQGDLVSMPNGGNTTIYGANFTGRLNKNLETSLTYAMNQNHNDNIVNADGSKGDQAMSKMGAIELRAKVLPNVTLTGTYVRTDAESYNSSKECRLDYKGTDLNKVGSFGAYFRYADFGKYGDMSHDDEWNSLPSDMKGWFLGVKYIPYKNVEWETFYSDQTRYTSGTAADSASNNAKRHLFRTQIDFHF